MHSLVVNKIVSQIMDKLAEDPKLAKVMEKIDKEDEFYLHNLEIDFIDIVDLIANDK